MTPHIVIVGADKGGVGKTMISRLVLDYVLNRRPEKLDVRAFDAQAPNGILKRFYPGCTTVVNVRESNDQVKIFDNMAPSQLRLVDLAAGELSYMIDTVKTLGFLDDVRGGKLRMTFLHVIGATQASFDEIASVKASIVGARHFLVTNHINEQTYAGLSDEQRSAADGVIDIPQLNAMTAQRIDELGAAFADFEGNDGESLVLRRYSKSWREKCAAHLAATH